ncbi:hypothetical protein QR680_002066 [Steinernema hermaphroditum]|uniref:Uncharacterized protein n=1 Tax=Steinernema hermaphroditum TaxID=289476 RepID=A0AA39H1Z5_9BILA|nr:hypothetical protein QR680_002066 [Steinernema hermaphroditum]
MTLSLDEQLKQVEAQKESWSLAQDNALCSTLDSFTTELVGRLKKSDELIEKTAIAVGRTSVQVAQLNTQLSAYKSNRFIENRVQDEYPQPCQAQTSDPVTSGSPADNQYETIEAIKEAVAMGCQVVSNAYKRISISAEEFSADENFIPEPIYEPLDPYINRPLPFLIGTEKFMQSPYIGLFDGGVSKPTEMEERVVIELPISSPPVQFQNLVDAQVQNDGADNKAVHVQDDLQSRSIRSDSDSGRFKPKAVSSNPSISTQQVIKTFSDSDSDSDDSLFGSSTSKTKPVITAASQNPVMAVPTIRSCIPEVTSHITVEPITPPVTTHAVIPSANSIPSSSKSSSPLPSKSNSPLPSPAPLPRIPAISDPPQKKPLQPPQPSVATTSLERKTPAKTTKPASQVQAPASSSIFDNSDSDSDLFASVPKKPPVLRPKSSALVSDSVNAHGGSSAARTDSLLNKKNIPTSAAPASHSLAKPSRSVFDDSSDSEDDLFGTSSSQNMRFPFSNKRKKNDTSASVKPHSKEVDRNIPGPVEGKASIKKDEKTKAAELIAKDTTNPLTNLRHTKAPSAAQKNPTQDSSNHESRSTVEIPQTEIEEVPINKESNIKDEQLGDPASMSSRKPVSTMKLNAKANDLFAAKLSAVLGQGPKLRPLESKTQVEAADKKANGNTRVDDVSKPVDTIAKGDASKTNDLSNILKSRPKGPANRRPKSQIRPLDEAKETFSTNVNGPLKSEVSTHEVVETTDEKRVPTTAEAKATELEENTQVDTNKSQKAASNVRSRSEPDSVHPKQPTSSLFDDSDEDLFASHASQKAPPSKAKVAIPKSVKQVAPMEKEISTEASVTLASKTGLVKKPGLFDDSDSDSDLFK